MTYFTVFTVIKKKYLVMGVPKRNMNVKTTKKGRL